MVMAYHAPRSAILNTWRVDCKINDDFLVDSSEENSHTRHYGIGAGPGRVYKEGMSLEMQR
jgi:hypothetical protein